MVALDEDVAPQPEPAEINRELARVRHRVQIRGVNRRESLVYFKKGSTARRLEERHSEDCQVGQVQWRLADPQRARQQSAEILDVPGKSAGIVTIIDTQKWRGAIALAILDLY